MTRTIGLLILLLGSFANGFGQLHAGNNPASAPDTILATHHTDIVMYAFSASNEIATTQWSVPAAKQERFTLEPTVIEEEQEESSSKKQSDSGIVLAYIQALTHFNTTTEGRAFDLSLDSKSSYKRYLIIQVFRV